MKPYYKILSILIFCWFILRGTECRKEIPQIPLTYDFKEKLTLYPYKKIYTINDTIWVQYKTIDKKAFDILSNKQIQIDTTYLGVSFNYNKYYEAIYNSNVTLCNFKVENAANFKISNLQSIYNTIGLNTFCNNDPYNLKVGFIPKKTGIYGINSVASLIGCPNKITSLYTNFSFTFDLTDCNKDIYFLIPASARGGQDGFTDVKIDNKQLFMFKVE